MTAAAKRRYDGTRRRAEADTTRARVVAAARDLMLESGYAATTMSQVAARAGVAVQTVYTACPGGKPGLAKAVYDATLAGDADPVPQRARPEVLAVLAEPDPRRKVALFAAMAVGIWARVAPVHRLLSAAAAGRADDVVDLLARTEHERLVGSRGLPEHLAEVGALRPGLDPGRAGEQLYALTSPELYERLTRTCGWTDAEVERWLTEVLTATLVAPETAEDGG